jgi:GNAT superfamily N-acetyltransferase
MLTILPAVPGDVPTILHLIRALADYEQLSHQVVASEALLHAALFETPGGPECLIAREDGEAVGFALYFHNFSTFLGRRGLYLEDLFVEPAQRGRGYGRALLQRLAAIAVERGCGRLEWSVLDWNAPAIGFYEAVGATVMPDWRICRMTGERLRAFAESTATN